MIDTTSPLAQLKAMLQDPLTPRTDLRLALADALDEVDRLMAEQDRRATAAHIQATWNLWHGGAYPETAILSGADLVDFVLYCMKGQDVKR